MWAEQALERFLEYTNVYSVLDIGSGSGEHAKIMNEKGKDCYTCSMIPPAHYVGDYMELIGLPDFYDGIWCSHVLEHQLNVNLFLKKIFKELKDDGVLAITVPPAKHNIVGGHVTLWNQGLLLYNLILAGFDCSEARVSPTYGYNISVIVKKKLAKPAELVYDAGDIEKLSHFFPFPAKQDFRGDEITVNWGLG
jgi:SAM-dependent methyltransferase